jgi:hypothetical protein
MAMARDSKKDPINEQIAMPAETAPFFWVTKDISTNESKGSKIMAGLYSATPSSACAPGAADAKYVQALIPKIVTRFLSAGSEGQTFVFWGAVPFLQKAGRFL